MNKKVNLKLVGLDGNAYCLMGAFRRQAKKEGWALAEIDLVLNEAKKSDYDHLVATLADRCINPEGDEKFDDSNLDYNFEEED